MSILQSDTVRTLQETDRDWFHNEVPHFRQSLTLKIKELSRSWHTEHANIGQASDGYQDKHDKPESSDGEIEFVKY